jgi:regulatory protein
MLSKKPGKDRLIPITPADALAKIYRYCAYQERSHQEVRDKLYSFKLYAADVDQILTRLITEGFLNEERFARAFAGGKFRIKKWGKQKIQHELERHGLTQKCIAIGMKEIETGDYSKALREVLGKRMKTITETNPYTARDKLAKFAITKGYEPDMVWDMVKELMPL